MRMPSRWIVPCAAMLLAASLAGGSAGAPAASEPARSGACPVCLLWDRYAADFALVTVEAGVIPDGAVYFLSSPTFRVVESIQRFAYERGALEGESGARIHGGHRGGSGLPGTRLVLTASAHGVFAILSSSDPAEVRALREEASFAARNHRPPRF